MASATLGRSSNSAGSIGPLLPVMPIAVRCSPGITCALNPSIAIRSQTRAIWAGLGLHHNQHGCLFIRLAARAQAYLAYLAPSLAERHDEISHNRWFKGLWLRSTLGLLLLMIE